MRKDVRDFIRRLEGVGLSVEPTPGHYTVLRDGKPLRKENGMPLKLPFRRARRAGGDRRSSSCANSASRSDGAKTPTPELARALDGTTARCETRGVESL
jgi:hypothetical protein